MLPTAEEIKNFKLTENIVSERNYFINFFIILEQSDKVLFFVVSSAAATMAIAPQIIKLIPKFAETVAKNPKIFSTKRAMISGGVALTSLILGGVSALAAKYLSKKEQKELDKAIEGTSKYVRMR